MVPGSVAMAVLCISGAVADYEAHGKADGSEAELEEECGPEELKSPSSSVLPCHDAAEFYRNIICRT